MKKLNFNVKASLPIKFQKDSISQNLTPKKRFLKQNKNI